MAYHQGKISDQIQLFPKIDGFPIKPESHSFYQIYALGEDHRIYYSNTDNIFLVSKHRFFVDDHGLIIQME